MSAPLLSTKFYMPPLRPELVPRPHLIERLNHGLQPGHKLTLIAAPAGFGKTTLLGAWVRQEAGHMQRHSQVAWLSLDEGDNDEIRFLTYIVAALQALASNVGRGVLAALQSPDGVNVEAALNSLLNELAELPGDVTLVLDDYHVIESRPVDEAVTYLLDHFPPQIHLAIASRIDPSLPLSRLRARGQIVEIRADELRFTADETAVFLRQIVDFELSKQDTAALQSRTEGWIAGLQLAAISMQGSPDVPGFVRSFTGSNHYVLDYLAEEVLSHQSASVHRFLLRTSILSRLTGPLCDALTGDGDGATMLDTLERGGLFIVPLDGERRWYRYHHLFADLLAHRLQQEMPGRIAELHRQASVWYETEGYLDDAIQHARGAADTERLAAILKEHWQDFVHRGQAARLRWLLDTLGPEITRKSPPLSMAYCWIHVLTDDIDAIPEHLDDAKCALAKRMEMGAAGELIRLAVIPSLIKTMEATVALETGNAEIAKAKALQAISLIPEYSNPAIRRLLQGAASYRLADAHRALGEYEEASRIFLAGLKQLQASENYFGAAVSVWQLVTLYQEQGQTEAAIRLCADTLDYIKKNKLEKLPPSGLVYLLLAEMQVDAGNIETAARNLEIGRELVQAIDSRRIGNLLRRVEGKLKERPLTQQPLVEPLSPRELEVLQLLAQGFSNREISKRLFVALDTVKGHNRQIFGKLGVKSRTQAVSKAISLRIIPSP